MVKVNDLNVEYTPGMNVSDVIMKCKFTFPLLIVKIDGVYVPRDMYNQTAVPDGSTLDIVHLISGG